MSYIKKAKLNIRMVDTNESDGDTEVVVDTSLEVLDDKVMFWAPWMKKPARGVISAFGPVVFVSWDDWDDLSAQDMIDSYLFGPKGVRPNQH